MNSKLIILLMFLPSSCKDILNAVEKPYKMLLFSTATYTGSEPRDGRICQAAMQVAVNWANSRFDLLGDYHIVTDFRDEGPSANLAPRSYSRFLEDAFSKIEADPTNNTFLAPAVIGTAVACQRISMIAQAHRQVQFTPGCSGPQFTARRNLYPNMYRNRINSDLQSIPMLIALFNEDKRWRQFGSISYGSGNLGDTSSGDYIGDAWKARGFTGSNTFTVNQVTDDLAWAVARSDTRLLMLGFGTVAENTKFLCLAWWTGVRQPHFMFFSPSSNFVDPEASNLILPGNCTREILRKQVQHTLWSGPFDFALENITNNTFGFGLQQFERYLDALTNGSRSPDYVRRHRCFDAMEQAILSMDSADRLLRLNHNSSLKDFPTNPVLILKAVNKSASESDFIGLRVGRIKYNDRIELDSESQYVAQWNPADGLKVIYKVWFREGASPKNLLNVSYYDFEKINSPVWLTRNGEAPQDLSNLLYEYDVLNFPFAVTMAILISAAVLLLCIVIVLIIRRQVQSRRTSTKYVTFVDFMTAIGGLLCNAGSLSFILKFEALYETDLLCQCQVYATGIGCVIIVGVVLLRMLALLRRLNYVEEFHHAKRRFHRFQRLHVEIVNDHMSLYRESLVKIPKMEKSITMTLPIFIMINLVVLLNFLVTDPGIIVKVPVSEKRFIEALQTYIITKRFICQNQLLVFWMPIMSGIHCFLLVIGSALAFAIRKAIVPLSIKLHFYAYRMATINMTTICAAILSLIMTFSNEGFLKVQIISLGIFILSNSTCGLLLSPVWVKQNPVEVKKVRFATGSSVRK